MSSIPERIAALSPEKRDFLLRQLQKIEHQQDVSRQARGQEREQAPFLQQQARPDCTTQFPLSFAQERLWFLDQLAPNSSSYILAQAFRISGPLQVKALERSLAAVVQRHAVLRTTFATQEGEPAQIIAPNLAIQVPVIDLCARSVAERDQQVRQLARADVLRPFDLTCGPLLRVHLLRLVACGSAQGTGQGPALSAPTAPQEHVLLLTLHHIVTDAWSMQVLMSEMITLYQAEMHRQDGQAQGTTPVASPQEPTVPELPIQYVDYALWQRQWLQGEVLEEQLAYWRGQLTDLLPLELPTDHPRPAIQTERGAKLSCLLPKALREQLLRLCQKLDVTLFMLLLTSFQVLLMRYTGQSDISIGTPIANRTQAQLEGLIGFFVNTLVLRTDLGGNPTFLQALQRVREVCLGAYMNQDIPFEKVVAELVAARDMSRTPLFQVVLVLQNIPPLEQADVAGMSIKQLPVEWTTSKFDLTLFLTETKQGLACDLEYSTDLFEASTMTRMLEHFQTLLQGIVQDPQARLFDLPLLTEEEQEQVLAQGTGPTWNVTQADHQGFNPWCPHDSCIHQLFEQQAERTPDVVALVFEEEGLTYAELNQRTNQLAHHLQRLGVGPEVLVGICMERSLEMIIGILGVLKAGGAYVPLDPAYPRERLAFMMHNAQVTLLLTQEHLCAQLPVTDALLLCLDSHWPLIARQSQEPLHGQVETENLAYVIYTSGSTGQPKGVLNKHRSLVNLCFALRTFFIHPEVQHVSLLTSISFDISINQIFPALIFGKTLYIIPEEIKLDAHLFLTFMQERMLHLLDCVPSYLDHLLTTFSGHSIANQVAYILVGGEKLEHPLLQKTFAQLGPSTVVVNIYGLTEIDDISTLLPISVDQLSQPITIGLPIQNTQVYILDAFYNPLPVGMIGELFIAGEGLSRGYLNQPARTAEKFVPNPFGPGDLMCKTGDLAKWTEGGQIELLGRIDHQVKLRGYRIELEEIEAILHTHAAVQESVVVMRGEKPGEKQLIAYVVTKESYKLDTGELRRYLQDHLPTYMIPSAFVPLSALPLLSNGKLDRRALPAPSRMGLQEEDLFTPRTALEQVLADLWASVLRIKEVGIRDNFFELGGDSILSLQIIARARLQGLHFTLKQLFQYQTIEQLSFVIQTGTDVLAEQGPVLGSLPLTPIQHWFFDLHLPAFHHWNQALFLQVGTHVNGVFLQEMVHIWLKQHDALRLRFTCVDGEWRQEFAALDLHALPFSAIDLSQLSEVEQDLTATQLATQTQASLNIMQGPHLRVVLFERGKGRTNLLLMVIHHLAVDAVSWRILLEDLQMSWEQVTQKQPIQLPVKTSSFKMWAEHLVEYAQSNTLQQELSYWLQHRDMPLLPLPQDLPADKAIQTEASRQAVSVRMTAEETRALLQDVPTVYHAQMNEVLLTVLALTLKEWTGASSVLLDLEGHGREDIFEDLDVSRTVGWFTALFPIHLDLTGTTTIVAALKAVKEQLRSIPHHGIGYGILRYLSADPAICEQLSVLPAAEISFNYLGQLDQALSHPVLAGVSPLSAGPTLHPQGRRPYLLDVTGQVSHNQLTLAFGYSQLAYRRSTIERLANHFAQILRQLVALAQVRYEK